MLWVKGVSWLIAVGPVNPTGMRGRVTGSAVTTGPLLGASGP